MKVCFFHSYMFLFEHLNYITSFDLFSLKKNVRYVVHFNDLFTDHELNEVHCKQFIVRLDDISKVFCLSGCHRYRRIVFVLQYPYRILLKTMDR